ncbi:S-layer homology domain-containing protein [Lentibacillus lipolyticus]|nr:S-layer homology domain-containing protein [Lentibacillus lipolyticus]
MSNTKKFRNIAVSSLAATAAVAVVAPAVSADSVSFTDVQEGDSHYDGIMALAEQGIVAGYEDGSFGVYDNVTRQQVAVMLANALNLDTPADVDSVLSVYDDVDANSLYAEQIAAVTKAGAFTGNNGKFNPGEDISREQMASVLVSGLGLDKHDNGEDVDVNLDNVSPSHADNVQVLANLSLTVATDDFRPSEEISRGAFATMLHGALNVEEPAAPEIKTINTVTPNTIEVTFSTEVEAFDRGDVSIDSKDDDHLFVSSVDLAEDGKSATLELYDDMADDTSYDVIIAAGEDTFTDSFNFLLGEVSDIQVSSQVMNPEEDYDIEYSVYTDTGVDVTESTDVTFHTDDSNVAIDDGTIQSDSIEDDDSFFVEIAAGDVTSNRVKITANGSEAEELVEYAVGEVEDWEAEDFEPTHDVAMDSNPTLNVLFHDQYGEAANNADVTFESLNPNVLIVDENNGTLTPREEGTADVRVTNGDVSEIVTIDVVAAAEFAGLSFEQDDESVESPVSINPSVDKEATVDVQLKDQYGNDFKPADAEELTVEVDGESVEVQNDDQVDEDGIQVNTSNGSVDLKLKATDEFGTSTVTVSNEDGSISESFDVHVQEAGEMAGYELQGVQNLDLFTNNEEDTPNEADIQVFPVDEDGVEVSDAKNAVWTVTDEDGEEVANYDGENDDTLNLVAGDDSADINLHEPGTYTIEATVGDLVVASETIEVVDSEEAYEAAPKNDDITLTSSEHDLFSSLEDSFNVTQGDEDLVAGEDFEFESFDVISNDVSTIAKDGESKFVYQSGDAVVQGAGEATLTIGEITIDADTGDGEDLKTIDVNTQINVTVDDVKESFVASINSTLQDSTGKELGLTFDEATVEEVKAVNSAVKDLNEQGKNIPTEAFGAEVTDEDSLKDLLTDKSATLYDYIDGADESATWAPLVEALMDAYNIEKQ